VGRARRRLDPDEPATVLDLDPPDHKELDQRDVGGFDEGPTPDHDEEFGDLFPADEPAGFTLEVEHPRSLWIDSDAASGEPSKGAEFVQLFLATFRPTEAVGFEWAHTCSRPVLGAFGGGAALVTAENVEYLNTATWLHHQARGWHLGRVTVSGTVIA
jgi:hypothetical protein